MYLKICLLILLLLPAAQKGRKAPLSVVAGQWQLDEVRSPNERAKNVVWTIKVTGSRVDWLRESTVEGKAVDPILYIYAVGPSEGRFEGGTRWTRHVEFDENRLIIRERLSSRSTPLPNWNVYEFEVKDHGYTLYYKHTYGRDVVVRENALYFRPVPKKKK